MSRIFVGMSGGVDSTAAAAILKDKGHDVAGITLKLWGGASGCCGNEDILWAKKACSKLGIKHYVIDGKKEFKKYVVDYFIRGYLKGETPNPCAVCNETVKFKIMINMMKENKFDFVATGHYAVIDKNAGRYFLKKGRDKTKTQEYFLSRIDKDDLKYIKFPLGKMKKKNVKKIVEKAGLARPGRESQEACFLKKGETPYEFILKSSKAEKLKSGGWLCGTDGGRLKPLDYAYFKYTVGQRKGLNYSAGRPMYVVGIDAAKKNVIIGEKKEVLKRIFNVRRLNMFGENKNKIFRADVKVRYLHTAEKAIVYLKKSGAKIEFDRDVFAVTPGQLAVFYKGTQVIGGGFIV